LRIRFLVGSLLPDAVTVGIEMGMHASTFEVLRFFIEFDLLF